MEAITVKQPWALLIVENIKPIENRTWPCPKKHIGKRVLIHAGMKPDNIRHEIEGQASVKEIEMFSALGRAEEADLFGCIIGSVEVVDCVINHPSIWAEKSMQNTCPLCGKKITNLKPDRQWCPDCSRVLDKGINYDVQIYNWVLANPIKFKHPIPCKGKLSFWDYPMPFCPE